MIPSRPTLVLAFVALFALNACVAPPPRTRVVYHEGSDQGRDQGLCHRCGTVRDVDQVELRQGTSGGGALLGAIIGGLIGNSVGHGNGRAAATAIGAVAGAAVGDSAEEEDARRRSGYAWQFRVQLDDGRWARVTQRYNPDLHPGDRVILRGDHLEPLQR
ncbi:MAG: glycine zipper 2TM domain-containing protein [Rudaea sp.]